MSETNNFPICRKCGQVLQSNARFCVYCGTEYVQENTLQTDATPFSPPIRKRRSDRYIQQNQRVFQHIPENNTEIRSFSLTESQISKTMPSKHSIEWRLIICYVMFGLGIAWAASWCYIYNWYVDLYNAYGEHIFWMPITRINGTVSSGETRFHLCRGGRTPGRLPGAGALRSPASNNQQ